MGNPFYTIEYLLLKSIDARLARKVLSKDDSVLNVGCGFPINEIIFHSWGIKRVVGIDIDESVIRKGKEWLSGLNTNIELSQGNALSLGFHRESFDVVVSFSAIEHVRGWENYGQWIENMGNVAKREVVLTTSNRKNVPLFLLKKIFFEGMIRKGITYEHFFTPKQIEHLLSSHGLEVNHFDTNWLTFSPYAPFPPKFKSNRYTIKFDVFMEGVRKRYLRQYGQRMGFIGHKKAGDESI